MEIRLKKANSLGQTVLRGTKWFEIIDGVPPPGIPADVKGKIKMEKGVDAQGKPYLDFVCPAFNVLGNPEELADVCSLVLEIEIVTKDGNVERMQPESSGRVGVPAPEKIEWGSPDKGTFSGQIPYELGDKKVNLRLYHRDAAGNASEPCTFSTDL